MKKIIVLIFLIALLAIPSFCSALTKKATLINDQGKKVVVAVGSPAAQQLFGQGYWLMGSRLGAAGDTQSLRSPVIFDTETASTTSRAIPLKGAKKATLFVSFDQFTPGHATSTFSILASGDDINYATFYKLFKNAATTTTATFPWSDAIQSYTATTTSDIFSLDLTHDSLSSIKASTTQTYGTGGVLGGLTIKSLIEY